MTIIEFDRRCGTDDIAETARQMGNAWIDASNPHRVRVDQDQATVEDWLEDEGFGLDELTITAGSPSCTSALAGALGWMVKE